MTQIARQYSRKPITSEGDNKDAATKHEPRTCDDNGRRVAKQIWMTYYRVKDGR
jgi:hypothetical protein